MGTLNRNLTLKALVIRNGEHEEFSLIENKKFMNFNKLHEILGCYYESVNDDLMSGDLTPVVKYENGTEVLRIEFYYEESVYEILDEHAPFELVVIRDNEEHLLFTGSVGELRKTREISRYMTCIDYDYDFTFNVFTMYLKMN